MRIRSPIEMMVDKACGFDPNAPEKPLGVHLRCPICKTTKPTVRDRSWPKGTHCCEFPCTAHHRKDDGIRFFNREGGELFIS